MGLQLKAGILIALPPLLSIFIRLSAGITITKAMAEIIDSPALVTKLLDTLISLIYPPPRKLFSEVVATATKTSQVTPSHMTKTFSIRTSSSSSDASSNRETSGSSTLSTHRSAADDGIVSFTSTFSDTSPSDIGISVNSVSKASNNVDSTVPPRFENPTLIPVLFCDAEGVSLSRNGELCLLEIHVHHRQHQRTYIIDTCTLKDLAFTSMSTDRRTSLKSILEDSKVPKVFFDVRMDSDALYGQYRIAMAGVIDLQLMELASRMNTSGWTDGRVKGLKVCLALDAEMDADERDRVQAVKARGKRLFAPEDGGSYEVFRARPLTEEMVGYCVVDVAYMPSLYENYNLWLDETV